MPSYAKEKERLKEELLEKTLKVWQKGWEIRNFFAEVESRCTKGCQKCRVCREMAQCVIRTAGQGGRRCGEVVQNLMRECCGENRCRKTVQKEEQ
jgi:hypothetical protein